MLEARLLDYFISCGPGIFQSNASEIVKIQLRQSSNVSGTVGSYGLAAPLNAQASPANSLQPVPVMHLDEALKLQPFTWVAKLALPITKTKIRVCSGV